LLKKVKEKRAEAGGRRQRRAPEHQSTRMQDAGYRIKDKHRYIVGLTQIYRGMNTDMYR